MNSFALGMAIFAVAGASLLAWALSMVVSRREIKDMMAMAVPPYVPAAPLANVKQILMSASRLQPSRVEEEMIDENPMSTDRELLARIDERTRAASTMAEQKDIFLRGEMDKVSRAIAALPGELDAKLKGYATTEALSAVSKRLEGVENNSRTVGMAVILAFVTAIGAVVFKGVG